MWLFNRGDHMCMFDCILFFKSVMSRQAWQGDKIEPWTAGVWFTSINVGKKTSYSLLKKKLNIHINIQCII
jgi:hypothetical protein